MTQYILSKKVTTNNALIKHAYKLSIIIYSFYIAFSPKVFALEAEAPLSISFEQMMFDDTAALERKMRDNAEKMRLERIEKIERYYARHDLPLQHEAEHFINAAEEYDIDWRLVAAIGFIESTGGKHACQKANYSAFGWGSCTIDFDSYAESIDIISMNLGGHNPNTEYFYKDKDIRGILESYNPPSVVADYADQVMRQMEIIDAQ